jgi:hypothetical protein
VARVLQGLAQKAAANKQEMSETVVRRIARKGDALMKHALLAATKWALQTMLRETGVRATTTVVERRFIWAAPSSFCCRVQ